jgi:hypothetical protein
MAIKHFVKKARLNFLGNQEGAKHLTLSGIIFTTKAEEEHYQAGK